MKLRLIVLTMAAALPGLAESKPGLPVRETAADYNRSAECAAFAVGAETLSRDQVEQAFATDLNAGGYVVVEVGFFPKGNKAVDVSTMDFTLRFRDQPNPVRPVSGKTIAGVLQRRSRDRGNDVLLYPSVGVGIGSDGRGGTGGGLGVGVGVGGAGGAPREPASTDRDRQTIVLELTEKGLPEGATTRAVAGYLYFPKPAGRRQAQPVELEYRIEAGRVTVPLRSVKP